jgi:DNA mismatch repair protein MutS2
LLHPSARARIDGPHTKLAVSLAFATGVAGGLFVEALDRATVAPSSWLPAAFAGDLFVHQFASMCFGFTVEGAPATLATKHLVSVLSHPPSDPAIALHRRAILSELVASKELRESLEKLYALLCRLRTLLEGATGIGKWDPNRRQLDILQVTKEILDCMGDRFASAESGLKVLHAFAEEVRAGEPYRSLSDLLRYDERLATLNLQVTVGADGQLRGFQILSIQENAENPFVNSAPRRWLSKLELFARGFRFSDAEVIARLIDAVFEGVVDELVRFVQLLGDVELYLGALAFRDRAADAGLAVCLPKLVDASEPRTITQLFNPLLLAHGMKPVPCDIALDRHDAIVLVTGPNSGGKTRLLQSMALAQLLAQCGLFVPAKEATIAPAPSLVVSLIQETKADQAEGRLGMELVRIRELFEQLPPGAMVILDELCSGTNPSEGEEIFELVIRMLTRLAPQTFITTHFLAFAARLEEQKTIDSLRFLQVVLGPNHEPTYQFAPGVAQTSLAGQTAARLGVTGDQLLALIERNIRAARTPAE